MKKFLSLLMVCMISLMQAASHESNGQDKLAYLEQVVQERKAELPQLKKQLSEQIQGSEAAQRLRTKINQYQEFITTAMAEIQAHRAKPSVIKSSTAAQPMTIAEQLKRRVQHDFKLPAAKKRSGIQ